MTEDSNLDRALRAWARHDAGDEAAVQRILQHVDGVSRRPPSGHRWWAVATGGLAAASVALALLVNGQRPSPGQPAPLDPGASFALLYTPTPDEEYDL
jgi:hypothetical protein